MTHFGVLLECETMKKLIPKLRSTMLLVFSILFGALTIFTPVFADDPPEKLPDEIIEGITGVIPSDQTGPEKLPDEIIEGITGGNDENPGKLPDEIIEGITGGDDASGKLPDEIIEGITGGDSKLPDEIIEGITGGGDASNLTNTCQDETKGASWILCTAFELVTNASDTVYGLIEDLLVVEPLATDTDTAIYRVWDYMRGFTNVIFVIFLIIVIYSQITGLGINNYGVKRILPRLIIAVILVNLSYIICALLVDASNIVGSSISGIFEKILADTGLNNSAENALFGVDWNMIYLALTGSAAALALFTISSSGLGAAFWTAVLLIIGVFFSIVSGLITIGLRQVVVTLLVTISPLAFVAYLLPNTEKWFNKWKALLAQMIFFYPIFAMLFYTSKLAGLTIIAGAIGDDGKASLFKVIVGLAVQVLPLFLSVSLLKMSGTILGKVSSGLDKAFGYAAKPLQGWAMSHREQNKQRYLAQNIAPGARLRNFLTRRQVLREMNTLDNQEIVTNRAAEAAFNKRASYLGIDKNGKPIWGTKIGPVTWRGHANSYTRRAARAHVQKLSTAGAQARLANSLSDHGSLFSSDHSPYGYAAKQLSARSANAFEEMAIQEFWKVNIEQNDQEYLINRYLGATNRKLPNHEYNYNRLISSAAGSFGYKGEKTIIAQVVKRSADIEAKRRAEAAIVINKFGYSKEFRNMMLDRRYLDDDGFALDSEGGERVEDENYQPLPGKTVKKWHKYIYVDEHNKEFSRAKGDKMSPEQLKDRGIRKIRYSDITDDDGNVVSHVYEDDAGYVKEMIMNDTLIGDPIARRFATELGLPVPEQKLMQDPVASQYAEENARRGKGEDRRYTSSYIGAYPAASYSEHNAAFTSMLLAQLRGGNINSNGQLRLAEMMSFNASGKVGKFLLNDGVYFSNMLRLLSGFNDPEVFEYCLNNADIALYGNQNSEFLDGLRLSVDKAGNPQWVTISHTSPDITLEDKKNYIKHKVFPKYIKKILGALGRRPSPNVLDGMKPENVKPLLELLHFAGKLGEQNADKSIPFEQRLDGNADLFENTDPNLFMSFVDEHRQRANAIRKGLDPDTVKTQRAALDQFKKRVRSTNPTEVSQDLQSILDDRSLDFNTIYGVLQGYCEMNPLLRDHVQDIQEIAENYLYGGKPSDGEAGIAEWLADGDDHREEFLEEIRNRFL